jgi:hypothetical protein
MNETLKAVYIDGTFVPRVYYRLPNNVEVELTVTREPNPCKDIIDPEARKEILNGLIKRMKRNRSSDSRIVRVERSTRDRPQEGGAEP